MNRIRAHVWQSQPWAAQTRLRVTVSPCASATDGRRAASAVTKVLTQSARKVSPEVTVGKTYAAERKAQSLSLLEPRQVVRTQSMLFTQSRSGLTPRSSGPATAAVRACVVRSVMLHHAGPAVHRSGPLSSNVRRHRNLVAVHIVSKRPNRREERVN